jgi:hypothetical protein
MDAHKRRCKEYYEANREEQIAYLRQYRKDNKEVLAEKDRIRKAKLRHESIEYRVLCSLRARMNAVLSGNNKSAATCELLGCSIEFFIKYIESQFIDGMNWDNYGVRGWHLDHIVPCSSFDMKDSEQQKECFYYMNIQPLWAEDNLRKSDKVL